MGKREQENRQDIKDVKIDKMILAIVREDDYSDVISELNKKGFYATVLHSSGGFLKRQSVTIMVGLNHEELDKALEILKKHGERTVTQYEPICSSGGGMQPITSTVPMQVRYGGVVLFVIDVEQYARY